MDGNGKDKGSGDGGSNGGGVVYDNSGNSGIGGGDDATMT